MTQTSASPLRQIGKLTKYIDLLQNIVAMREFVTLRREMKEAQAQVAIIERHQITLIGAATKTVPTTDAVFELTARLKRHDAEQYAVTIQEIEALNEAEIASVEAGPTVQAMIGDILAIAPLLSPAGDAPATESAPAPAPSAPSSARRTRNRGGETETPTTQDSGDNGAQASTTPDAEQPGADTPNPEADHANDQTTGAPGADLSGYTPGSSLGYNVNPD